MTMQYGEQDLDRRRIVVARLGERLKWDAKAGRWIGSVMVRFGQIRVFFGQYRDYCRSWK